MENTGTTGIKVNLFVNNADWELVINLLKVLRRKAMVEFELEDDAGMPGPEIPELTVKKLNAILEEAEQQTGISYEDFKARYRL